MNSLSVNMNYYFDTEFIEGSQTKRLLSIPIGKTKPTIDLISIGIVAEDGREYYAISKDFNLKEAWNRYDLKKSDYHQNGLEPRKDIKVYWIRENVLKPIFDEWNKYSYHTFNYKNMKYCINMIGKSNKQIAKEVVIFTQEKLQLNSDNTQVLITRTKPEFYGYYSDYDWVVFCRLFGRMIDLPKGFPMYCIDLKQILDEKQYLHSLVPNTVFTNVKDFIGYPKQTNEHNALQDAKWNKALYEFLNKL